MLIEMGEEKPWRYLHLMTKDTLGTRGKNVL